MASSSLTFAHLLDIKNKVSSKETSDDWVSPLVKNDVVIEKTRKSSKAPSKASSEKPSKPSLQALVQTGGRYKMTREAIDPRFVQPNTGNVKQEMDRAVKNYAFLNDLREKEMKRLKKQIKKSQTTDDTTDLELKMQKLQSEEALRKKRTREKVKHEITKRQELESIRKTGKVPFFNKKKK